MKFRSMLPALAFGLLGSSVQGADLTTTMTRVHRVTLVQPERAIARLATQGIGYSVLHDREGLPQSAYRVHVTCTITERFAQTYCPTPQYEAYCPNAEIICR